MYLADLALPPPPSQVHRNRIMQLAREGNSYRAQPLTTFDSDRRYALLVAHLHELQQDVVDATIERTPAVIRMRANCRSFSDRDSRTRRRNRAKMHAKKGAPGTGYGAHQNAVKCRFGLSVYFPGKYTLSSA